MALTTLNLAALPVKFVAIPVLVGLAAGTGAVAAYVTGRRPRFRLRRRLAALPSVAALPSTTDGLRLRVAIEQATPAKPDAKPSCEKQTWPYLDNRCIARGSDPARKVRLVVAPRASELHRLRRPPAWSRAIRCCVDPASHRRRTSSPS